MPHITPITMPSPSGDELKAARVAAGLSQVDAAQLMGYPSDWLAVPRIRLSVRVTAPPDTAKPAATDSVKFFDTRTVSPTT